MSKARARERAKAKAGQKAKKRDANAEVERPGQSARPGHFDPGSGSIKGPRANANAKNFGAARRGAARST